MAKEKDLEHGQIEMKGWIKLHRKLLFNPIMSRPNYLSLWVNLLLKANHEETKMIWNGGVIIIKEGQFIGGRKGLAKQTGISESTVEDILRFLEKEGQIRQQKTNKYRLITILNWKEYQSNPTTSRQQSNNKPTQTRMIKKDKEDIAAEPQVPFSWNDYIKRMEDHKSRHIQVIAFYFKKKGIHFDTQPKAASAIRRHLRAAKEVANFSDEEIVKAYKIADKEYPERYTIETLLKILTR